MEFFIRQIEYITLLVNNRRNIAKKIWLVIFIGIFLVGCNTISQTIEDKELTDGTVIITPTSLFDSDDLKNLEPHLNMKTGCVEVKYKGDKEWLWSKYEIWENGKIIEGPYDNFGTRIAYDGETNGEYNGVVSISIKDNILLDNLKTSPNMTMITAIDGSSSRKIIDRYDESYGSSEYNLLEPVITNDNEEIAVWALIGIDNSKYEVYSTETTIEDTVKKGYWALVLKIYFK